MNFVSPIEPRWISPRCGVERLWTGHGGTWPFGPLAPFEQSASGVLHFAPDRSPTDCLRLSSQGARPGSPSSAPVHIRLSTPRRCVRRPHYPTRKQGPVPAPARSRSPSRPESKPPLTGSGALRLEKKRREGPTRSEIQQSGFVPCLCAVSIRLRCK